MKIIISTITIFLLCSIQNVFAQEKPQKTTRKSKSPKIVSCGVCNQKAIYLPQPEYPKAAQAVHASGMVNVEILIDEKGNVESAKAVSGHPLLQAESVNAALKAKFTPFTLSGIPVKVSGNIVYKFKTDGIIDPENEEDDKDVIGIPVDLVKPSPPFCNCKFGKNSSVIVTAEIDEQGNVIEATAISGHPILKLTSQKAALESKFLPTNVKAKIIIRYNFIEVDKWSVKISSIEIADVKVIQ